MTGIRLLMAISLVCSASVFAQTQNDAATSAQSPAAANAESLKMLPALPPSSSTTQNSSQFTVDRLADPFLLSRNDGLTVLNGNIDPKILVSQRAIGGDSYCLKIRSYVVARDSKNSDSVHPAGYTTCVPANRFRLRTTVEHQGSEGEPHVIQR